MLSGTLALVCSLALISQDGSGDARQLESTDRDTRIDALARLAGQASVKPETLASVVKGMRRDAAKNFGGEKRKLSNKGVFTPDDKFKIPDDPRDTSLTRIRTAPDDHYNKDLFLVVSARFKVRPHDEAFRKDYFYAFEFRQLAGNGQFQADVGGSGYLLRDYGRGLAEDLAVALEAGATDILLRVRCVARSTLKDRGEPQDLLEILDYQTLDSEKMRWRPWAMAGIDSGMLILRKNYPTSIDSLLGIVMSPETCVNPSIDDLFRKLAADTLIDLAVGVDDRTRILKQSDETLKAMGAGVIPNEYKIKRELTRLAFELNPEFGVGAKPKSDTKGADPESRAAGLFRIASNLEANGNIAAAIKRYQEVVQLYPKTAAAKEATAKLKKLGK